MWRPWENSHHNIAENNNDEHENEQRIAESSKKKRQFLSYEEKQRILNIYKKIQGDGHRHPLMTTSKLCGIPRTSLWRIVKHGPTRRKTSVKKLDSAKGDLDRRVIPEPFKGNIEPNAAKELAGVDAILTARENPKNVSFPVGLIHESIKIGE